MKGVFGLIWPFSSREEFLTPTEEGPVYVLLPNRSVLRLGIAEVFRARHLLKHLILRAVRSRYRATRLGYAWVVMRPLSLSLAYVFIMGGIFHVKSGPIPFPLFVFLGISNFFFFTGSVTDITGSLAGNASIFSKVYYPRLTAPLSSLAVNLLDLVAAMSIVGVLMVVYRFVPSFSILYYPLFTLGLMLTSLGIGLVLAAHSVRYRDISMGLPVVMRVLLYTMPAVYPLSRIPERFHDLYFLNPLAVWMQGIRWSVFHETLPPLWAVGFSGFVGAGLLLLGLISFHRVERSMVDTL